MITPDHNEIRTEILSTGSYRELLEIRRTIQNLKGSFPFTIYADLQGRVEERIRIFEYPLCESCDMKVVFSNGLTVPVVKQDCVEARGEDKKFTDHIFAKYVSTKDIVLDPSKITGTYDKDYFRRVSRNTPTSETPSGDLSQSVQSRVDLLVAKIENFESMYRKDVTKIMGNLESINVKIDIIYRKIFNTQEEEDKEKQ